MKDFLSLFFYRPENKIIVISESGMDLVDLWPVEFV